MLPTRKEKETMTNKHSIHHIEELISVVDNLRRDTEDSIDCIAYEHALFHLQSRYKSLTGKYYHVNRQQPEHGLSVRRTPDVEDRTGRGNAA
jgi:hypothetical protein